MAFFLNRHKPAPSPPLGGGWGVGSFAFLLQCVADPSDDQPGKSDAPYKNEPIQPGFIGERGKMAQELRERGGDSQREQRG